MRLSAMRCEGGDAGIIAASGKPEGPGLKAWFSPRAVRERGSGAKASSGIPASWVTVLREESAPVEAKIAQANEAPICPQTHGPPGRT